MSTNAARRQRLREQMKEFYGDPDTQREKETLSAAPRGIASGVSADMSLDSEYFNIGKYTTELLRRESLKGLLEVDTELLHSIRRLDTDLQDLMYRNYSRFISATDTIRVMRENFTEMDAKLQDLSGNVAHIESVSQQLGEKLHVHRSKIEETINTNRMLRKVQFLVGLPVTMQGLLDRGELTLCVKHWVAGDGFFVKHTNMASIDNISSECRRLAQELYTRIEDAMCALPLDEPDSMDNIHKLVENLRLMRATSLFAHHDSSRAEEENANFQESILRVLMRSVCASFESGAASVQRSLRTALALPDLSEVELAKRAESLDKVALRENLAGLKSTCAIFAVNCERAHSLLQQLDSRQVAVRVAEGVQPVLIDILAPLTDLIAEYAVSSISSVGNAGFGAWERPEVVRGAVEAISAALTRQLKHVAVALKSLGASYLDTAHSQQSHTYSAMVDQSVSDVLTRCLRYLVSRVTEEPVAAAMEHIRHMSGGHHTPSDSHRAVQIGFGLSRFIFSSVAAVLGESCRTTLVASNILDANRAHAVLIGLAEVAMDLQHRGVVLLGQLGYQLVQEDAFGGDSRVDPTSPSAQGGGIPVCLMALLREWDGLYKLLQGIPPPRPPPRTDTGSGSARYGTSTTTANAPVSYGSRRYGGSTASRGSGHSGSHMQRALGPNPPLIVNYTRKNVDTLQSSVDRIFSKTSARLHTLPHDGRPAAVIRGVVLFVLRALVDTAREVPSYTSFGFQRVQVSCTFLLRMLLTHDKRVPEWTKGWEDSTFQAIQKQLDEVCASAYERYETKVPLTNVVLERIMKDGLPKGAQEDMSLDGRCSLLDVKVMPSTSFLVGAEMDALSVSTNGIISGSHGTAAASSALAVDVEHTPQVLDGAPNPNPHVVAEVLGCVRHSFLNASSDRQSQTTIRGDVSTSFPNSILHLSKIDVEDASRVFEDEELPL